MHSAARPARLHSTPCGGAATWIVVAVVVPLVLMLVLMLIQLVLMRMLVLVLAPS